MTIAAIVLYCQMACSTIKDKELKIDCYEQKMNCIINNKGDKNKCK